jgi:hypothetical protein
MSTQPGGMSPTEEFSNGASSFQVTKMEMLSASCTLGWQNGTKEEKGSSPDQR